jgi:DNA-binding HxlR family transcriptional regulator
VYGELGGVWVNLNHLRRLSEILGHKWDLLILARLAERPLRYSEIACQVRETDSDLTDGVLTKNLKRLTDHGLIHREPIDGHRVYDLTRRGRFVVTTLAKIAEFDDEDLPDAD